MKTKLRKELLKLATGELASVAVFWLCYVILVKEPIVLVMYPLGVLTFLLLQGSIYWFICLIRLQNSNLHFRATGKIYCYLKYLNLLLIIGYVPMLIVMQANSFKDYFWGIFLILFAVIELINYFYVRLSYSNVGILIEQIKTKRIRKSKLAKEIEICYNGARNYTK